ncbi:MAG: N-6 DNA methylase [Chloroflexota bacterium]|nr:N-6 DNA methylase [Chloroflexota bacterium]
MSTTNAHTNISSGVSSNSTVQVLVSFKKAVIDRFQIMADGKICNYSEYLKIPKDAPTRQGYEANAVGQQFARYVLEWLGYSPVDWIYNQPQAGKKANRPDYTVKGSIGTAFIVEDKNSTLDFDEEHLKQMRRYCMGTAGYAVLYNMRRLFAIRFLPSNPLKYEILVDIAVEDLFGIQPLLSIEQRSQEANLALFHLLFSKERFTRFSELVQKIGAEEQVFDSAATPLDTSQAVQNFIDGSRQSLNHLRLAALSQIQEAVTRRDRVVKEEEILFRIAEAYRVWSERQSDQEDIQPEVFAEQVAYVFFVRLLLVRVLEDKYILQPRLASDGGFLDWSRYVSKHFKELEGISILNENFCDILSRKASHYYLHFFQQTIFDWFNPDDFLLVETLEFLCRYNFNNITSDIIGFTYEAYIDRHARDRKGHFLTRQEVVEYMLDLLEYTGPQIIGRRILDPASGSGSFLVHAARRYRQALVTFFCTTHNLPNVEALQDHPTLYQEFARRYLDDLSTNFFGMELNPFACYLVEMNLLIQGLDELFVLQQTEDVQPVERFQIYNTDSLHLPREILDSVDLSGEVDRITVPDRLSDRLADEAYPIKAKLQHYAEGFFYLISNPPYVSSKQEELNAGWFRNTGFYNSALSGDMNLYLLFLRLGLYYLADYGHMIYIVPLTIFGDKSASAIRKLLKSPPFSPSAVVRFYRGDILFPGVDQAVGIVRLQRSVPNTFIVVSGGNTIQEAKAIQFRVPLAHVIEAVPQNHIWQGNWLVAQSQEIWNIWQHVRQVSANLSMQLGTLLDGAFDRKQGDVNATYLNPLRVGTDNGRFSRGDIAIYKGEDIKAFAPLPASPSDWARPFQQGDTKNLSRDALRASLTLEQLKRIAGKENGIVLRQVARLNTREHLIATWFERRPDEPRAFTNELWRMLLKEGVTEEYAKALLAIMNSNVTAYLMNLFSTNNHVSKDELERVPIPDPQTLPVTQLAALADELLRERADLEKSFVVLYRAKLPEFDDGNVYLPPSAVIAVTQVPKLQILALIGRSEVKNNGPANGRIRSLRARNLLVCTIDTNNPNAAPFAQILDLFLREPERENETWSQAQSWLLPDTVAATGWLQRYHTLSLQAQTSWNRCVSLQRQIDEVVADWYGFGPSERQAINEGLPWARRRRSSNPQVE